MADEPERFAAALAVVPVRQGRFERLLRLAIRLWCRICAWQVEVTFHDRLPTTAGGAPGAGCVVAAAPHRAWVEPFLLVAAWPADAARLIWLADGATVTSSWWRRWILPRLGVIPIVGGLSGPRSYADLAAAALARGAALAVFPEVGPPSPPDRPRRISPGFAYIAAAAGAPVIPVAVGGTHRIVRGSVFSVDVLAATEAAAVDGEPFGPAGRTAAHDLRDRYGGSIAAVLPERTRWADARGPRVERWRWLRGLFR